MKYAGLTNKGRYGFKKNKDNSAPKSSNILPVAEAAGIEAAVGC